MAVITNAEFLNILRVTPRRWSVGVYGWHGCGKTQCSIQAAKILGYEQICVLDMGIIGDAGDIIGNPLTAYRNKVRIKTENGVPVKDENGQYVLETYQSTFTDYAEPFWWPIDESKPAFVIVDEANRIANRSVQNAMMRLINERKVGNRTLHPDSRIVATFNPTGIDHYHVQEWDIAYRSRFLTYEFCPSSDEWVKYGLENGFNGEVLRYIQNKPIELVPWENEAEREKIKENDQTKNARAWEKISDILNSPEWEGLYKKDLAKFKTVVAGGIGFSAAETFVDFLRTKHRIDIDDLLSNFKDKHKDNVKIMGNFDQAMLVRDVMDYLRANAQNVKKLKGYENSLLDFLSTVRPENSQVGFNILQNSCKKQGDWGGEIYRILPKICNLKIMNSRI